LCRLMALENETMAGIEFIVIVNLKYFPAVFFSSIVKQLLFLAGDILTRKT